MGRASKRIVRNRKKDANKKLSDKLNMFDKLGTACYECGKRFDRQNKINVVWQGGNYGKQEGTTTSNFTADTSKSLTNKMFFCFSKNSPRANKTLFFLQKQQCFIR